MRYGMYLGDLRPERSDSRGTINYALGLSAALPPLLEGDESLYFLGNPEVLAELPEAVSRSGAVIDVARVPRSAVARLRMDHLGVLRWAHRRRLDVLHFPKGHLPAFRPKRPAVVATVHDDIAVRYARKQLGSGERSLKSLYFARIVAHSLASADTVLTVSNFSAQRLRQLRDADDKRIVVTYEAPTLAPTTFVPRAERAPTILILGSRFPHKRTAQAVAWSLKFVASGGLGLRVSVTGELDSETERLCQSEDVERIPRSLPGLALAHLVASSRVLVFHSAYEGFGLPPVEAFSLGTPAVYQRIGAMAEVMSGFPGGYDDFQYESFADELSRVINLTDGEMLDLQAQMRSQYRWADVAARTLAAYRSLASD